MSRWQSASISEPVFGNRSREGASRILFLDRDGVVIVDRNYLSDPTEVELVPGAAGAMAAAHKAGFLLVGLSNQSGIGRGYFSTGDFGAVMDRLTELLRREGVGFDAFFYCPHKPQDGCRCRKPAPGLLDEAAEVFSWRAADSWLVGDKVSDVQLAREAGLHAVLVRTGHGLQEERRLSDDGSVLVVADLPAAVDRILAGAGS